MRLGEWSWECLVLWKEYSRVGVGESCGCMYRTSFAVCTRSFAVYISIFFTYISQVRHITTLLNLSNLFRNFIIQYQFFSAPKPTY